MLKHVLAALDGSKHVRPIIYTDAELKFLDENVVPGIRPYRETLTDLSHNRETHSLPHEEIIHKLDEAGLSVISLFNLKDLLGTTSA